MMTLMMMLTITVDRVHQKGQSYVNLLLLLLLLVVAAEMAEGSIFCPYIPNVSSLNPCP